MKVAAVDCGTNSVRLLIAEPDGRGGLRDLARELRLTRLGQGVDATGRFDSEALQRTLAAVSEYGAAIRAEKVERVRFVATSAARDASNREGFFGGVRQRLGVEAEIISGDEEARLSFRGARAGIPDAADPVLVMDVGGGSTELVTGQGGDVQRAVSLDMGSVRLRERFLAEDPPTPAQVAAARRMVDALLDESGVDFARAATWIGVGGTATTLSGAAQRLETYDRAKVHGSTLGIDQLDRLATELLSVSVRATMAHYLSIPAKRAEVICAGALICERVARRVGTAGMVVSESDILDGIALGLLDAEP